MPDRGIDFVARNIVNQLGDLWNVPAELRQATNDQADKFVDKLLNKHTSAELRRLVTDRFRYSATITSILHARADELDPPGDDQ